MQAAEGRTIGRLDPLSRVHAQHPYRSFAHPSLLRQAFLLCTLGGSQTQVQNPTLPLASLATLYRFLDLSGPQFIHL